MDSAWSHTVQLMIKLPFNMVLDPCTLSRSGHLSPEQWASTKDQLLFLLDTHLVPQLASVSSLSSFPKYTLFLLREMTPDWFWSLLRETASVFSDSQCGNLYLRDTAPLMALLKDVRSTSHLAFFWGGWEGGKKPKDHIGRGQKWEPQEIV